MSWHGTRMEQAQKKFLPTHPKNLLAPCSNIHLPPFIHHTPPTPPSSHCFVSPVPLLLFCCQYNSPKQSNKFGHAPLS